MAGAWDAPIARFRLTVGLVVCFCALPGCGGTSGATDQLDVDQRLGRLLRLYTTYFQKNQRPPPNEEALRQFGQKLSPKDREDYAIGDDLESIFVSPRDNQKFVIKYNIRPDATQTRAIAWEATPKDGLRSVALSNGYTTTCDEETFQQYKK